METDHTKPVYKNRRNTRSSSSNSSNLSEDDWGELEEVRRLADKEMRRRARARAKIVGQADPILNEEVTYGDILMQYEQVGYGLNPSEVSDTTKSNLDKPATALPSSVRDLVSDASIYDVPLSPDDDVKQETPENLAERLERELDEALRNGAGSPTLDLNGGHYSDPDSSYSKPLVNSDTESLANSDYESVDEDVNNNNNKTQKQFDYSNVVEPQVLEVGGNVIIQGGENLEPPADLPTKLAHVATAKSYQMFEKTFGQWQFKDRRMREMMHNVTKRLQSGQTFKDVYIALGDNDRPYFLTLMAIDLAVLEELIETGKKTEVTEEQVMQLFVGALTADNPTRDFFRKSLSDPVDRKVLQRLLRLLQAQMIIADELLPTLPEGRNIMGYNEVVGDMGFNYISILTAQTVARTVAVDKTGNGCDLCTSKKVYARKWKGVSADLVNEHHYWMKIPFRVGESVNVGAYSKPCVCNHKDLHKCLVDFTVVLPRDGEFWNGYAIEHRWSLNDLYQLVALSDVKMSVVAKTFRPFLNEWKDRTPDCGFFEHYVPPSAPYWTQFKWAMFGYFYAGLPGAASSYWPGVAVSGASSLFSNTWKGVCVLLVLPLITWLLGGGLLSFLFSSSFLFNAIAIAKKVFRNEGVSNDPRVKAVAWFFMLYFALSWLITVYGILSRAYASLKSYRYGDSVKLEGAKTKYASGFFKIVKAVIRAFCRFTDTKLSKEAVRELSDTCDDLIGIASGIHDIDSAGHGHHHHKKEKDYLRVEGRYGYFDGHDDMVGDHLDDSEKEYLQSEAGEFIYPEILCMDPCDGDFYVARYDVGEWDKPYLPHSCAPVAPLPGMKLRQIIRRKVETLDALNLIKEGHPIKVFCCECKAITPLYDSEENYWDLIPSFAVQRRILHFLRDHPDLAKDFDGIGIEMRQAAYTLRDDYCSKYAKDLDAAIQITKFKPEERDSVFLSYVLYVTAKNWALVKSMRRLKKDDFPAWLESHQGIVKNAKELQAFIDLTNFLFDQEYLAVDADGHSNPTRKGTFFTGLAGCVVFNEYKLRRFESDMVDYDSIIVDRHWLKHGCHFVDFRFELTNGKIQKCLFMLPKGTDHKNDKLVLDLVKEYIKGQTFKSFVDQTITEDMTKKKMDDEKSETFDKLVCDFMDDPDKFASTPFERAAKSVAYTNKKKAEAAKKASEWEARERKKEAESKKLREYISEWYSEYASPVSEKVKIDSLTVTAKDIKQFGKDHYGKIIIAVAVFFGSLWLFKKLRSQTDKLELEGKKVKGDRRRSGAAIKDDRFEDKDDEDDSTNNNNKKSKKRDPEDLKNNQEMMDRKERQTALYRWLSNELDPSVVRTLKPTEMSYNKDILRGEIAAEKLLDYETIHVRIGGLNFTLTGNPQFISEQLSKARRIAGAFENPVFVLDEKGHVKKVRYVSHEAGIDSEEYWLCKAKVLNITLTKDELTRIMDHKTMRGKNDAYNDIIVMRAIDTKCKNEGVIKIANVIKTLEKREGLLGGRVLHNRDLHASSLKVHNDALGVIGHMTIVGQKAVTCAHIPYGPNWESDVPQPISEYKEVESAPVTRKFELENVDKVKDFAIYKVVGTIPPSYAPYYGDYQGIGLVVTCDGIAVGSVYKKGNMLWHHIPTTNGHSGAAILTADGRLLGIHRACAGLANVGTVINSIIPNKNGNEGAYERNEIINLSYLDGDVQPRMIHPTASEAEKLLSNVNLHLGPEHEKVGFVEYKFGAYNKIQVDPVMISLSKEHEIPPITDSIYGVAKPNLDSIQKDAAKYTRKLDTNINWHALRKAESALDAWVGKTFPAGFDVTPIGKTMENIKAKSATGFPEKTKFFSKGDYLRQRFHTIVKFMEQIRKGEDPAVFFDQIGKEEPRLLEKLQDNKIRSINSSSVHTYFAESYLFRDFVDQASALPFFVSGTTAGWSPWYGSWNEIWSYLSRGGKVPIVSGLDFEKWDSSILSILIRMACDCVIRRTRGPDVEIFYTWYVFWVIEQALLILPLTEAVALIIKIFRGVKSGQLITFIINCLINRLRHFYCRIRANPNVTILELLADLIVSCGDDFAYDSSCGLTIDEMAKYSAELGIKLTVPDAHVDYNLEFAGANTLLFMDKIHVPAVNKERMAYSIYLVKKGMTAAERISKLDNLVRIICVTDYKLAQEFISIRDRLIKMSFWDHDVQVTAAGCCSLIEAVRAHIYVTDH